MKNNEKRRTSAIILEAQNWRYYPLTSLFIESDPPQQDYYPDDTEPLEVDQPELLDSMYGRQN